MPQIHHAAPFYLRIKFSTNPRSENQALVPPPSRAPHSSLRLSLSLSLLCNGSLVARRVASESFFHRICLIVFMISKCASSLELSIFFFFFFFFFVFFLFLFFSLFLVVESRPLLLSSQKTAGKEKEKSLCLLCVCLCWGQCHCRYVLTCVCVLCEGGEGRGVVSCGK